MAVDIAQYVEQLTGEMQESAYKASDALGRIGSEEVVDAMIKLLEHPYAESRIIAARTLGLIKDNKRVVEAIMHAVKDKENSAIAGDLLMSMEELDISDLYVEMFRLYLFGTFKVSTVAKGFLDFKEFDITPRVIKKAQKHWDHYSNNVKRDEIYELRKAEVESMLEDLRAFLS
jgi:hypothetical protein